MSRVPPTRSQIAVFTKKVADFTRRRFHAARPATPIGEVLAGLSASQSSSTLVVDEAGRLVGILTERDIAQRIALRVGAETPVERVMTTPVKTIAADDLLFRAVGRMRRERLRHMPVIDRDGKPVGVLDLNEALAAAAARMVDQIDRLTRDASLDGLAEVKRAQAELAQDLFDDNIPAPEIQALITDINIDLHRRVLEGAIATLAAEGWGPAPVPMTLLIMGSGGRGENFLFPDQDNGLILADYPDADHGRIDAWYIALAERLTQGLDRIGFPLCKGGVMATNPLWRKTAAQWREQIALWGERRSPVAVLFADIFMDFRAAWGDPAPAATLRRQVGEMLRRHPGMLTAMANDETNRPVALGFFGGLKIAGDARHPGRIDLKLNGTLPLVGSLRLFALRAGLEETSTLGRLTALAARGIIGANDADKLRHAFAQVTLALLRQQLVDFHAGREVGNYVDPDGLSGLEREHLVEALKAIDRLRKHARSEFTGALW
ncbi:MAG: CBS domain-containing protein [Alphaproteobacteria bacterium]|nr:CBS domain-containing protein [Alphaproteobacteria bacterium]